MELWDAYDAEGNKQGFDLVRGQPVPAGSFHVVAEIAVRHADGSFLLTRRDLAKPSYPGYWELTVGGSVQKGEGWLSGAHRELLEETGIDARELTPAFRVVRPQNRTIYVGYLCRYDGPKDAVVLQESETIDYRWLAPRELLDFVETPHFVDMQRQRWQGLLDQVKEEMA